jgi:PAS domain-containing protein
LALLEAVSDGVCTLDAGWRITFANKAAREIFAEYSGTPEQIEGRSLWQLFPAAAETSIERALRRRDVRRRRVGDRRRATGADGPFALQALPWTGGGLALCIRKTRSAAEANSAAVGSRRAPASIARFEAKNRAWLAEIEAMLRVIPVGIGIALDPACREVRRNAALREMLGTSAEAESSNGADASPASYRFLDEAGAEVPAERLPMQTAIREKRDLRDVDLCISHASGRTVRLLGSAGPLLDEAGEVRGAVGAFVDVTAQRSTEERQRFFLKLDEVLRPLVAAGEIVNAAACLLGEHMEVSRCAYADVEEDEDTFNLMGDYCRGVPSIVGRYRFAQFGAEALRRMRADQPYVVHDIETHGRHRRIWTPTRRRRFAR